MNYYKANTSQDYAYIASLFHNGNNKYLIKKSTTPGEVQKEHEKNQNIHTFILEEDQNNVGWFSLVFKTHTKTVFFGMIIDHPFQGRSLGKKTLHHIEHESRKLGAEKIELDVFIQNKAAIEIYKEAGFTENRRMIHMTKEL